jgi:transcriptional regulator with XRE-family HTH domain
MPEDARRLVGQNVWRLRLSAEISQAELAARMGVDRAYVSGLEQGEPQSDCDYTLAHRKGARSWHGLVLRRAPEEVSIKHQSHWLAKVRVR